MASRAGRSTEVGRTRAERRTIRGRRRRRQAVVAGVCLVAVLATTAGAYAIWSGDDSSPADAGGTDVGELAPASDTGDQPEPTAPPTQPTTVSPTEPPRDPRLGSGEAVTFAFGGDVHFEGSLRSALLADPQGVLAPIAPSLSEADVAVVNLETAITERGVAADKQYVFRTPPVALDALAAAGVDAVSMANNHGIDYGADGLTDSLAAKAATATPAVIGIGADAAEAYRPYRVEVRGQRIAVIAATQVLDDNLSATWTATNKQGGLASAKRVDRILRAVRAARNSSDTVVVYLHWGIEGQTCPSPAQQELATQLVDAGADIVVGGHAHRLQGAGRLGGAFVAYGLGNFVWYSESGLSGVTGVLTVTATGREIGAYQWTPAVIRGGVPQPVPAGGGADAAIGAWDALRGCTGLAA